VIQSETHFHNSENIKKLKMEVVVCRYFQTGYCKFKEHCRKHHIKELCETVKCTSKTCKYRHKRICKFFMANKTCKFGEHCEYLHKNTGPNSEIDILVDQTSTLKNTVKILSEKITILEAKMQNKTDKKIPSSKQTFKCEVCEYKASTKSVLKRHTTTKHKKTIPPPEKERNRDLDTSLQLLVPPEERAEATSSPPHPVDKCFSQTSSGLHFKCDNCNHESISEPALHGHKSLEHDKDIPHTGQWDNNKCHICNTAFNITCHFKNHLIEQHGFSDISNECMNCESTKVGIYRAMPYQAVCMNCTDCELYEANL
jgi:hypothetical protein